jgi:hypothetical protein
MVLLAAIEPAVLAGLAILLIWFSLRRLSRRRARTAGSEPTAPSASTFARIDGPHLDAPAEFARWEVAMHETARELMGRLDSKIVIVEQLVREAREVADRIEALLPRIDQANSDSAKPANDAKPAGR